MLLAPGNPVIQNCTHATLGWVNNINKLTAFFPALIQNRGVSFCLYFIVLNVWIKFLEKVLDGKALKEIANFSNWTNAEFVKNLQK